MLCFKKWNILFKKKIPLKLRSRDSVFVIEEDPIVNRKHAPHLHYAFYNAWQKLSFWSDKQKLHWHFMLWMESYNQRAKTKGTCTMKELVFPTNFLQSHSQGLAEIPSYGQFRKGLAEMKFLRDCRHGTLLGCIWDQNSIEISIETEVVRSLRNWKIEKRKIKIPKHKAVSCSCCNLSNWIFSSFIVNSNLLVFPVIEEEKQLSNRTSSILLTKTFLVELSLWVLASLQQSSLPS